MKRTFLVAALCAASFALRAHGQEFDLAPERPAAAADDSYYYSAPPQRAAPPNIAQQKAQARGEQRMQRLAAMRAYGMSGSRPTASAMAFTTMYAPAWQMPGGRPFAWWQASNRGMIIYRSLDTPAYR
ncbi:MAG: hypothetical protein KDA44_13960 [Planctomycetales bacterium]|nr:hypothetical protein [Planctomycetales bacterium]